MEIFSSLRSGRVSALEISERSLNRIKGATHLNAFAQVHAEDALEQARIADQELAAGQLAGPLHGIPLAIKDNFSQEGLPCPAACRAYLDYTAQDDAQVVQRLAAAGAIIVARTNMHELANGVTSEDSCYGPVHNPWRSGYHPGGSSGGSAAAVAAGCIPAALGTDTGGSVRIPASLCGVVGLKPSAGLLSNEGVLPLSTSLDHVGVITRTVLDAALLLEVMTDSSAGDWQAACHAPCAGLRLGILSGFGLDPDPGVAQLFSQAITPLEEICKSPAQTLTLPDLARGIRLLASIYPPEAGAFHRPMLERRPHDFGEVVRADLQRALKAPADKKTQALKGQQQLKEVLDQAMESVDVLLCPTTPHPARPIGSENPHTYLSYTCPFNLTGQPAISVPMGQVDGLPVGLQMIARPGEEAALFSLATKLEEALPQKMLQTSPGSDRRSSP